MLNKLLKYDFKELLKVCLPLYGFGLFSAILYYYINDSLTKYEVEIPIMIVIRFLALMCAEILVFGIPLILVFVIIWITKDFFSSVFGKRGYLIHTLPVSTAEIFWSKIISSTVMLFLTTLVYIGLMIICQFEDLSWSFEIVKELYSFADLEITYLLISILILTIIFIPLAILVVFSAIALGHLTKYRIVMSIIFYVMIQNIISFLVFIPSIIFLVFKWVDVRVNSEMLIADVSNAIMIGNLIASIMIVSLGFITYKIMDKKLNLI